MNNNDINSAWAAVEPILRKMAFHDIRAIIGLAGFDIKILNSLGYYENWGRQVEDVNQLVTEIVNHFLNFPDKNKLSFLNIVIEEVLIG